jgi:hypothetical protein
LKLRLPQLDCLIVQTIGLGGTGDPELLDWAATNGRVILTHDVNTMIQSVSERLKNGLPMPGVIIVPEQLEIGRAITDLEVLIECSTAADLENQIQYVPL